MPDSPQDVHKKVLGRKGEKLVVKYLKKRGYKILATNYSTPFGEADIIAQDKDETVFVEVKTRAQDEFGSPFDAITNDKKRRYLMIAKSYQAQTGKEPNARFDVAGVFADGKIEYLENAF